MVVSTAFPPDRRARGVAIETNYVQLGNSGTRFLPSQIAVMGQGGHGVTYTSAKRRVLTADEVGAVYGYTSPIYLMMRSLLPTNGDGVGSIPVYVYPLQVTGTPLQSVGSITPSITGGGPAAQKETHYIKVNNMLSKKINVVVGETVATWIGKAIAALNGILGMPGTASDGTTLLNYTAGWDGDTGDNIHLELIVPDDSEWTVVIVQPTGGDGTVAVDAASEGVNLIGEAWDTDVVSALDYDDATNLNAFQTFGEGRWLPGVHKPLVVYTGSKAVYASVTAVTDARSDDKVNAIVTNPSSNDLPFMIAADYVRRVARRANENPPYAYGGMTCPALTAALDSDQWDGDVRDAAVKLGCSTIEVVDGKVKLSDVVTCYHPTGEDPPPYAYVVDIKKLCTMIYNFDLEFESDKWNSVPLIPDDQKSRNSAAKKPKDAVAAMAKIFQNAAEDAIISDPDYAIENSSATISSTNPKRLDVVATFKLSGNVKVLPITLNFGFYYGG